MNDELEVSQSYTERRAALEQERRESEERYVHQSAELTRAQRSSLVKGSSGRKLKWFMPYVTDKIIAAIRSGAPQQLAAQYAGISAGTLVKWLKEGEEAAEDDPLHIFWVEVQKARGEKAKITLERIQEIAESVNSWQGLAWLLERSYPKEFGKSIYGGDPSEAPEIKHIIEVRRDSGTASPELSEGQQTTRYQLDAPEDTVSDEDKDVTAFPIISPVDDDLP
jgi:hypothetical protein